MGFGTLKAKGLAVSDNAGVRYIADSDAQIRPSSHAANSTRHTRTARNDKPNQSW